MRTRARAALVAAVLATGFSQFSAAQSAKFRHVASLYADDKGAGLHLPEGVGCNANGQVVVGDTGNDRLVRFTVQDKTVSGGSEIRIPELSAPAVVQLTSAGEIYALDAKRRRIVRLGPDGTYKAPLTLEGVPPPTTVLPKSFAIDTTDNLYVLDVAGARVLVLDAGGRFRKAIPLPDDAGFVTDLAVDGAGTVLAVDSMKRRVYTATKDASSFTVLGKGLTAALTTMPSAIAVSRAGIFIVEGLGGNVVGIGRDGSFLARHLTPGWRDGALDHPSQVCINDKDEVFIADRDNSRVQVFGLIR